MSRSKRHPPSRVLAHQNFATPASAFTETPTANRLNEQVSSRTTQLIAWQEQSNVFQHENLQDHLTISIKSNNKHTEASRTASVLAETREDDWVWFKSKRKLGRNVSHFFRCVQLLWHWEEPVTMYVIRFRYNQPLQNRIGTTQTLQILARTWLVNIFSSIMNTRWWDFRVKYIFLDRKKQALLSKQQITSREI